MKKLKRAGILFLLLAMSTGILFILNGKYQMEWKAFFDAAAYTAA